MAAFDEPNLNITVEEDAEFNPLDRTSITEGLNMKG
jgi:hypothetical protein